MTRQAGQAQDRCLVGIGLLSWTCHPHITLHSSDREGGASEPGVQSPPGSSPKDPRPLLRGEDWLILGVTAAGMCAPTLTGSRGQTINMEILSLTSPCHFSPRLGPCSFG